MRHWLSRLLSGRVASSERDAANRHNARLGIEILEDRRLLANLFVVPLTTPTSGTDYHTLQDALTASNANGTITIEPGAVADFNTDITQNGLTIQGDPNVPSSILPAYNISVDASNVMLKNLNLNFVSVDAGFNNVNIVRSTVNSIFIQGGPTGNGSNNISQNVITGNVSVTGNTNLGVASNDVIEYNNFSGFSQTLLTVAADNGAVIKGNTFIGGGDITTNTAGNNVTGGPQTAIAVNGGVGVTVENNTITLPGSGPIPGGVSGTFEGITVGAFDPADAGLASTTATAAPVVDIYNNAIATGKGTGLAITAVAGASGDRDTQVLVQGNDFHNNAIGVLYIGSGGSSISSDLGGGILNSLGGNNFRSFTSAGNANAAAIVLEDVGAGATLSARDNMFQGNGTSAPSEVFASSGTINVSSPLTNNQAFVQTLFNNFLARTGSITELNNWVNTLASSGQAAVVQGIVESTAALDLIIDAYYLKYLGRTADAGGQAYWVGLLQGGASLESIQAGFISSPEFISSNNSDYVQGLYLTFFGRTGSSSELAYWYGQLQQPNGLNIVANGFATSAENRDAFVTSFYRSYLHFTPTANDVSFYANQSADLQSLALQILDSSAFFNNG
jgi:hypothetical protein